MCTHNVVSAIPNMNLCGLLRLLAVYTSLLFLYIYKNVHNGLSKVDVLYVNMADNR